MSGFEVAGVVLGAIPIFISAAKQLRDGLDSFDKFLKKKVILDKYIWELETHQTLLRLHLQRIVGNTDLSAKIQKELVDSPLDASWRRQDVQSQIRRSLGSTADMFEKVIMRMAGIFTEQIKPDDTIPGHKQYQLGQGQHLRMTTLQLQAATPSAIQSFAARVKFTWRSPKRNETLLDLKSCNDNLFKLINAAEEARPYQRKQEVRKVHAAWQSRTEAQRLFEVLNSSCTCSSHVPQRTKLRIKPLTSDENEDAEYTCMYFDVSFERTQDSEHTVTVSMYKKSIFPYQTSGIRISVPALSNTPDKRNWKAVSDICCAIGPAGTPGNQVAIVIDESRDLWQAKRPPFRSRVSSCVDPKLSLEALYPVFAPFANKKWLIREKLILAIISAYSAVQLYQSPWLSSGLSSDHLFFPGYGAQFSTWAAAQAGNALGHPYISGDSGSTSQHLPTASHAHRNISLLSLGIVLLELHLNRSIRSANADLSTLKLEAMELLQEHHDDCSMSQCYYEAVRFCLFPKPDPSTRMMELSDLSFREMYYRNVILPLEEELHENYEVDQKFWDEL